MADLLRASAQGGGSKMAKVSAPVRHALRARIFRPWFGEERGKQQPFLSTSFALFNIKKQPTKKTIYQKSCCLAFANHVPSKLRQTACRSRLIYVTLRVARTMQGAQMVAVLVRA